MGEGQGLWHCDWAPAGPAGGRAGHWAPGALFLLLGTQWLLGSLQRALFNRGRPYRSTSYFRGLGLLPQAWPLEPLCKLVLPLFGCVAEIWVRSDGPHFLMCPEGSQREFRFNGDHINNWQHAMMYLCFSVSGATDLLVHCTHLPLRASLAGLGLAFAGEMTLMGLHTKDQPFDRWTHQVLTATQAACALFCFLELANPSSHLLTLGRVLSTYVQGLWFLYLGLALFDQDVRWDEAGGTDLAPLLYAPVVLVQIFAGVAACILVVYLLAAWMAARRGGSK